MCGHIISRLARYRIMFTDVNLKELIDQIVSDYGIINIGDLKKHDDYDEVGLIFSLQENSGKLYFNNDRIHICINSNNEIIEYDINLCCDVLIRKYINHGEFYTSSEIYEKYDNLDSTKHAKTIVTFNVFNYTFNKEDIDDVTSLDMFKNKFNLVYKYNLNKFASDATYYYSNINKNGNISYHYTADNGNYFVNNKTKGNDLIKSYTNFLFSDESNVSKRAVLKRTNNNN